MKQIAKDAPHGADKQCKSSMRDYARQNKQNKKKKSEEQNEACLQRNSLAILHH
jgi:hypothetical protein